MAESRDRLSVQSEKTLRSGGKTDQSPQKQMLSESEQSTKHTLNVHAGDWQPKTLSGGRDLRMVYGTPCRNQLDAIEPDVQHRARRFPSGETDRYRSTNFMRRDYDCYLRLNHFQIKYIDREVPTAEIRKAVKEELSGPGALLGYRAMTQKIRQEYHLKAPRDLVHGIMFDLDADGVAEGRPGAKAKKPEGHFVTLGPNWTYSLDGYDKLIGY
eukprot:gene1735-1932_t